MAHKPKTFWSPDAKGHLAAASLLSHKAPHLTKSAPIIQKKLGSFRAAAKLAAKAEPIPKQPAVPSNLPKALSPPSQQPPAQGAFLQTKPATPLKNSLPPLPRLL